VEALRDAFADHPDAQIIVHEGATHGFTHNGSAWDADAYRASFGSLVELLGQP
jgi:dienelactone hydrolase